MAYNPPRRRQDLPSMPEIVQNIIKNVDNLPDLLNCARVSRIWHVEALRRLYEGSIHDMRFRTPDTSSLNFLLEESRECFAQNMSFVKHLLVCPITSGDDSSSSRHYQAAGYRRLLELLLQPRGRRPTSLVIPFEFMGQDLQLLADLLPAPTVEFLAINHGYCQLVAPRIASADKLSNLKALTIYSSKFIANVDSLCRLLDRCSLKFFHYSAPAPFAANNVAIPDATRLFEHIRRHGNLEALVLNTARSSWVTQGPAGSASEAANQQTPWPRLKLLHLSSCTEYWLRELRKFNNLTSLHLGLPAPYTPDIGKRIGDAIIPCRHLQEINFELWALEDLNLILELARACPLLRGVTIRLDNFIVIPQLTKPFLFDLLRELPRLELLDILYQGLNFCINGSDLANISLYCPRLQVLLLPWVTLFLCYLDITRCYPQERLEIMEFSRVLLRGCWRLMTPNRILIEWRRLFPRLRAMPCDMASFSFGADCVSFPCTVRRSGTGASTENESDNGADEDMTDNTQVGFPLGYSPDWESFPRDFGAALGYEEEVTFEMHDRIRHMWRTNIELELVGWPVVPLESFIDPNRQSSIP
ncbi:hypothetical protein X797_001461 [Metarhizium robertsii]|uniref:Uncharacterized protein n=1 Tax=Metarhizium robertsii TaxID=568076 RepID=A0A0A1V9R3_9HYPO|nr:hypothetical protein X797_001461 [Metarhizium robertsii]